MSLAQPLAILDVSRYSKVRESNPPMTINWLLAHRLDGMTPVCSFGCAGAVNIIQNHNSISRLSLNDSLNETVKDEKKIVLEVFLTKFLRKKYQISC